jgi:plastocyanin
MINFSVRIYMKIERFVAKCSLVVLSLVLLAASATAQKKGKYACAEADPASICTAANTCGSSSSPCMVDVKRTAQAASATPSFSGAKGNSTFCVKVGTTVTWHSDTKNQGFVVDVGPNSPFEPSGSIIGGSDKDVSVVAKTPGCYKYTAGACLSGAIYGMCGNTNAEFVVIP